jgi:hypothetical protein
MRGLDSADRARGPGARDLGPGPRNVLRASLRGQAPATCSRGFVACLRHVRADLVTAWGGAARLAYGGAMSRVVVLVLVAVAFAALDAGVALAASGRWRPPLPGATVSGAFTFDRAAPYARGGRRGIDLRGLPGARVVAACAGTVTYAGRVPGWGRGVSLRCGGLVATELGLASAAVARGARVWPGAVVGRLAPRGLLRLGARRVGDRHGYVDPLELLGDGDRWVPPSVVPRRRPAGRRRPRALPPPAMPVAIGPPRPAPQAVGFGHGATAAPSAATTRPVPVAAPVAPGMSWAAVAGLGLLAAGVGGGGVARRRRPHRRRAGMALAQR